MIKVKSHILHICNDFTNSNVYTQLYSSIEKKEVNQIIFHPLRTKEHIGKREKYFDSNFTSIIYSSPLSKRHKFLFKSKRNKLYHSLIQQIDTNTIIATVATTLYSDGAIALKLYEKFGIPYVVCVRHTDINIFSKYRKDLNPVAREIIKHAKKVIFISPALENKARTIKSWKSCFDENKNIMLPNGIDNFWLNNIKLENHSSSNKFLFVGKLDVNKNYVNMIKAFKKAQQLNSDLTLTIVGKTSDEVQINKLIEGCSFITKISFVESKPELLELYRNHKNFIVFSIHETFGLVYLEALTQGLQIGYSKNQGVYGLFQEFDMYSAIPTSIESMKDSILKMSENNINPKINFAAFFWDSIAETYLRLIGCGAKELE